VEQGERKSCGHPIKPPISCTAIDEVASHYRHIAAEGRNSTTVVIEVGTVLKGNTRKDDARVQYIESCARGFARSVAAVEKGSRWHSVYHKRRNVDNVDSDLVKDARNEFHLRGADDLNSMKNCLARKCHVAIRVIAFHRVDSD
jgi:hypothetical protein